MQGEHVVTCDVCDQTIDLQKSLQRHMLKNHQAESYLKNVMYVIKICHEQKSSKARVKRSTSKG